jgi:hypothetical protein
MGIICSVDSHEIYVLSELRVTVPEHLMNKDTRPRYKNIPYASNIHKMVLHNSDAEHCSASEGGFCLRKSPRDIRANVKMAKHRNMSVCNVQPWRDIRFHDTNEDNTFMLYMKDDMPWTTREIDKLVSSLQQEGMKVSKHVIASVIC